MKLSEMIVHVGDENAQFQVLQDCVISSSTNKKGVTKITFGTQCITTNDLMFSGEKSKMTGFIVWLPTDKLPKTVFQEK